MKANLLIVSVDEFPLVLSQYLEQHGFSCSFSRGGIRTREILGSQNIDTIIWLFWGHELSLAQDLLKIFNKQAEIPIVFITQNYDELDFAERIKGLYANIDLNDDPEDLLSIVESACNQSVIVEEEATDANPPEIDFKNVVAQVFQDRSSNINRDQPAVKNPFKQVNLWSAVDQSEKKLLVNEINPQKAQIISKIKKWFG